MAHRKKDKKNAKKADSEEKRPSSEQTEKELQAQRLKALQLDATAKLAEIGPLGPKARAELEAMPGGKKLVAAIDSEGDPMKKLEKTQVAAVALESQRSGDKVTSVERDYPNSNGKGNATSTDVETDSKVVEVKGKDNSTKTSSNEQERKQAQNQRAIAKEDGKDHVIRSPSMNDTLADKTTKRGSTVDRRPFDYDGLKE